MYLPSVSGYHTTGNGRVSTTAHESSENQSILNKFKYINPLMLNQRQVEWLRKDKREKK